MSNVRKMENTMSLVLTLGMIISVGLVMIGGTLYLIQHGGEKVQNEFMQAGIYRTNVKQIWETATGFSAFGIIQFGILILVATQAIRVGLLVWFYAVMRDYRFLLINVFILSVLVYSLVHSAYS